jgi:hypothetical protein
LLSKGFLSACVCGGTVYHIRRVAPRFTLLRDGNGFRDAYLRRRHFQAADGILTPCPARRAAVGMTRVTISGVFP